ncbi:MAG: hypothetical protein QM534_15835 [Sediminibacterium sp.]|nr:hypothetical protein [Sediminibacterium sp.]
MKPFAFFMRVTVALCLVLAGFRQVRAQCTGCTTVISSNTSTSYTVNAGTTLCINAGVTCSGNIRLNGGTVCNSGTVTSMTFLSGIFNNYNTFNSATNVAANVTGTTTINCYALSQFTVNGSFSMLASTVTTPLTINIEKKAQFKLSGNLTHSKGKLTINVGVTGAGVPQSETLLSIAGNLTASYAELNLTNERESLVSVNGSVGLNNTYNKTITNRGSFTIGGFVNMTGNASGNGIVTVNNTGNFSVGDFLTAAVSNATVNITNDVGGVFSVYSSLTLGAANHKFVNKNTANINLDIIVTAGALINEKNLTVRDLDVRAAQATNSGYLRVNRNLLANTTTGIVNNNAFIDIVGKLSNKATFNLAAKSVLKTDSCINTGTAAYLKGPVSAGSGLVDYARLVIKGGSRTDGFVNGYLIVHDLTLTSNASNLNYGFDQVTNPGNIAGTVTFAARAASTVGAPIVINCVALMAGYSFQGQARPATICQGACTDLEAHLYEIIPTGPGQSSYSEIDLTGFTWQPGNLSGQYVNVCPTANTTYTASVSYLGCVFTVTVGVTVVIPSLVVNSGAMILLSALPASPQVLNATVSGGWGSLTYNWTPATYLSSASSLNPSVNFPSTPASYPLTYNLTVTDAAGCSASASTGIYLISALQNKEHYAILNRELDAGYYNTVLNNGNKTLFFMFEEEYQNVPSGALVYTIADDNNAVLAGIPTLVKKIGDNRFAVNISGITPALTVGQYYKLIVKNEKEEIWQGRFKVN